MERSTVKSTNNIQCIKISLKLDKWYSMCWLIFLFWGMGGEGERYVTLKKSFLQFFPVLWIRIRIGSGFNGVTGSVISWSVWCSLFMAEGFSFSLDINKLQFLIKIINKKFLSYIFFLQFLVIKTLDPNPDSLEIVNLDLDSMNSDLQLWFFPWVLPTGQSV